MAFQNLQVPFNSSVQFRNKYAITPKQREQLVGQALPTLRQLVSFLLPQAFQGAALRALVDKIRGGIEVVSAVAPTLSVYYVCQGSCNDLASATIRIAGEPELQADFPSFNTPIANLTLSIACSPKVEAAELETTYFGCRTDGDDGVFKRVNFLYQLRLRFDIMVGPIGIPATIRQDDQHLVFTPCCVDLDLDDFEEISFTVPQGQAVKKGQSGKQASALTSKPKKPKTA